MTRILITRISEEANAYQTELENAGFEVLSAPMLELKATKNEVQPDFSIYDGLIFTSAQGVRFLDVLPDDLSLPVYCVGSHTAKALSDKGFVNVMNAEGTARDIVPLIKIHTQPSHRLLHVCGRDVAYDLSHDLAALDVLYERYVVYHADMVNDIDDDVVKSIKNQRVDGVIFYSKRTLNNFLYLAEKKEFLNDLKFVVCLCISVGVRESVRTGDWGKVLISNEPNRISMMKLLQKWSKEL